MNIGSLRHFVLEPLKCHTFVCHFFADLCLSQLKLLILACERIRWRARHFRKKIRHVGGGENVRINPCPINHDWGMWPTLAAVADEDPTCSRPNVTYGCHTMR